MTSQPSNPFGNDTQGHDLFDARVAAPAESFGARLRAAREARGLDLETCAHALRLPLRVLRQLEGNTHEGLDYGVYLGSYITTYARHLGIDETAIQAEVARFKDDAPTLVATGGISHSRYLLERYATAATYVVLTAVIVVPMIWLGVRGTLDRDMGRFTPLDATPVAQQDAPAKPSSVAGQALAANQIPAAATSAPAPAAVDEQPLLASMVPNLASESLQPAKPPLPAVDTGTGGHSLSLHLAGASWVEVTASDGERLEYGLLPGDSTKNYHSDKPIEVRIGNATGAQVALDGQPVALDGYRHANVAHFRVDVQNGKATPTGF